MRGWTRGRGLLVLPAVLVLLAFTVLPLCIMAYVSVLERGTYGGVEWGRHTLDAYVAFLFERDLDDSLVLNPDYLKIFARSFGLAAFTTALCLTIGLPTALYMATRAPKRRNLLVFLVTIPFWTNLLVRTYAWILLLRNNGLIDKGLHDLGLASGPLDLLYTPFAIMIGLTYTFLPFMVLPVYASLEKLDWRLVEAAMDLGATRVTAFRRVVLPLSLPGVVAGMVLVFVPCLGAYVAPELLGGAKVLMIGNLIQSQFGAARNWPFGAALAFALLAIVLLAMAFYALRFGAAPGEEKGR
ncbi:MAG: ABC transporter permease [Geminicoccaceae bacterium]|nr:ABC transporter permease [Geminicoccaceae bacterium]